MIELDRRLFLTAGALALAGLPGRALAAAPNADFRMWHSPGCGCCLEWAKRIEAAFDRKLPVIEAPDIAAVKRAHGVPDGLRGCHTALIDGVVVEGHVPPADIRRLIDLPNRAWSGLAVPGMPAGAPGMDVGHDRRQPFEVIAFAADGARSVFARYPG